MYLKVKVHPNSKKEKIIEKSDDSFEIWIKEKPIDGKANRAVLEILRKYLDIKLKCIRLIKGARTRNKIYEISN